MKSFYVMFFFFLIACSRNDKEAKAQLKEFKPIYFEFGSDTISDEFNSRLDSIGIFLKNNPDLKFEIVGCAHPREPDSKNSHNNLAARRAKNVAKYLYDKFKLNEDLGYGVEVKGPALGSNAKYVPPAEIEFRTVNIVIER